MATKANIKELVEKDLKGFRVLEMTEVFKVDEDGRKRDSLGFFKDQNTAVAFAGIQTDSNWHKTAQAFVLTNGIIGYVIEKKEAVKIFDDKTEALKIKRKAIAKLSLPERRLLKLE